MKKLLIIVFILPLAGCDWFGSDDDKNEQPTPPPVVEQPSEPKTPVEETREEMIERELNLPPEPDKEDNLSILGGLDSNGNGVRDDIERFNAFTFYPDKQKIAVVDELARLEREVYFIYDDINALRENFNQSTLFTTCRFHLFSKEERRSYDIARNDLYQETVEEKDFSEAVNKTIKEHYVELFTGDKPSDTDLIKQCDEFLSTIE